MAPIGLLSDACLEQGGGGGPITGFKLGQDLRDLVMRPGWDIVIAI